MAAMAMTHTAHAMTGSFAGLNARSMTDTLHRARVAFANVTGAVAVNAAAFAVNAAVLAMDAGAFAMDGLSILRVQRCLARPMSVAHDPAEVEPVVVSLLSPAFPSLVQCYKIVETLARFVSKCAVSNSPQPRPVDVLSDCNVSTGTPVSFEILVRFAPFETTEPSRRNNAAMIKLNVFR
jgi:hypothetical protein